MLSLTLSPDIGGNEVFEGSFDFSKFPNLQEVDFEVCWMGGGLLWVPAALSTLKPTTSPCLSTIRLKLVGPPTSTTLVETLINDTGNDLRWVVDEVFRIEREFDEAVHLTALWDPVFEVVLNTLGVRFRFVG